MLRSTLILLLYSCASSTLYQAIVSNAPETKSKTEEKQPGRTEDADAESDISADTPKLILKNDRDLPKLPAHKGHLDKASFLAWYLRAEEYRNECVCHKAKPALLTTVFAQQQKDVIRSLLGLSPHVNLKEKHTSQLLSLVQAEKRDIAENR